MVVEVGTGGFSNGRGWVFKGPRLSIWAQLGFQRGHGCRSWVFERVRLLNRCRWVFQWAWLDVWWVFKWARLSKRARLGFKRGRWVFGVGIGGDWWRQHGSRAGRGGGNADMATDVVDSV